MSETDPRIEELERRVAQLETLVRQLATRALEQPRSTVSPAAPAIPAAPVIPVRRAPPPPPPAAPRSMLPPSERIDWEQWFGRRALLFVGVFAMIATAGFFVKYAIDRGWISPWVRVNGGVLLGALVAIWGDRIVARGMRLYGGAIIGAGSGLAYLAIWAAAARYGLIGPYLGIVLLLGVTVSVASRAVRHRVEGLCAWALVGAFAAPFFVPSPDARLTTLLGYLALVALSCGGIAFRLGWRRTFALAVVGFYFMPLFVPLSARADAAFAAYLVVGGLAVLLATERTDWWESRLFCAFVGSALLIDVAGNAAMADSRWLTLAGSFLLTLVVWRHHVALNPFADPAEGVLFLFTPWATVALAAAAGPSALVNAQGLVPAVLAIPYLAAGWPRRSLYLVAMGFALIAVATWAQWNDVAVAIAWCVLAFVAVAADRWNGQPAGRPAGLVLGLLGIVGLFAVAISWRVYDLPAATAFRDRWTLAWVVCTVSVTAAAGWFRSGELVAWFEAGRTILWTLAAGSLWLGGTFELGRAFTSGLAADLAISAFWLVYAAALVALGFRLGQQTVRVGGLALAGLAALKIVFYDLSQLEALYRVGSFFVLAVIALAVAYAYNRRRVTASEE